MKLNQEQLARVSDRMRKSLASLGAKEFSSTADGTVSIRMNDKLEVLEVQIHSFATQSQASVERAVVTAVNQTIREIIRDRANELAASVSQEMGSSDNPSNR